MGKGGVWVYRTVDVYKQIKRAILAECYQNLAGRRVSLLGCVLSGREV